jgi:hypothetical protein
VNRFPACAILSALLLAALGLPAASAQPPAAWRQLAGQACSQAGGGSCAATPVVRRALSADVAEYSFTVRVGPGEHDRIGLHRVVRERAPFVPAHAADGVFFVHGDAWGFDAAFVASAASPSIPDSRALPVFLAEHGVDVWGIDLRWALVPAGTTDFAFLQNWGLATQAGDVGLGLAVARALRGVTGSGFGPLDLLGWSRGGQVGYAYVNAEAALPAPLRQVKGFVPVDIYVKTDVPALRQAACTRLAAQRQKLAQGVFSDATGQLLSTLGSLAAAAPADPSPILAGLTNRQAGLLAGEATFNFFGGLEPTPFYHFTGGVFDAAGLPAGLSFTEDAFFLDFLRGPAPFEPVRLLADAEALMCDQEDVPFDDHFAAVKVPVFYLGADGGFGTFGLYSVSLLGSADKSSHIVDLRPPAERFLDFGHADLFLAANARTLAWEPLLAWIEAH